MEIKGLNLIVDTNYILYRNVHALKDSLYADLEDSLEMSFNNFINKFPFKNVYMVTDSKISWRKRLLPEYKAQRKEKREKDDIDWEFVYNTYELFKSNMSNPRITHLEGEGLEGDDIIRHLIKKSNENGESVLTVASDGDLQQLLDYSISDKSYINMQWWDTLNRGSLYLPEGYRLFMDQIRSNKDDLFSSNLNAEFIHLVDDIVNKYGMKEVDTEKLLFVKIIHGDKSDNISSVIKVPGKKDPTTFRGLGEAGAKKVYDAYKVDYPQPVDFNKSDWLENVIEYICENKKVDIDEYDHDVRNSLIMNNKLVHLDEKYLPIDIKEKLNSLNG